MPQTINSTDRYHLTAKGKKLLAEEQEQATGSPKPLTYETTK